jgi:iron(III) transport system ATP-binding protein
MHLESSMKPAEVRLERVSKSYGELCVVREVSLKIRAGEFFTFLGPSGCGKTTLLRMIAGFVEPDEGSVYIDDRTVNHVPPWSRDVGMVFQNYALWPHMTVFENVAFGLRERKVARAEVKARVVKVLEQVDLKGVEGRRPSQLSGGQQQRVALARTLVIQPRVLLLDEPLSNLDAKLRIEMRLELLKLQRDLGLTTIYVTHDQEEALAMSNTIAVIHQGQVVQEGAPRDIYERPADDFIAGFVGQTNLLPAQIMIAGVDRIAIELVNGPGFDLPSSVPINLLRAGDSIFLSVRPEAIALSKKNFTRDAFKRIDGKIVASAYQGAFIEYEIAALGKALKARVMNPKGKDQFQPGDEVAMTFAPEDILVVPLRRDGSARE